MQLLCCVWSSGSGSSCVTSWSTGGCTELPCSSSTSFTSTSGIMLIHSSSLSPAQPYSQCFDALRWPVSDEFCLDWAHPCKFVLEFCKRICWPRHHEVVTMCCSRNSVLLMAKQILRAELQLISPTFDMFLPVTLPIACCVPCAIHDLFQKTSFRSVGAQSVLHW